jgi:hypothetical protein
MFRPSLAIFKKVFYIIQENYITFTALTSQWNLSEIGLLGSGKIVQKSIKHSEWNGY